MPDGWDQEPNLEKSSRKIRFWEVMEHLELKPSHPPLKIFEIHSYTMSKVIRTALARNMFKGDLIPGPESREKQPNISKSL